MHVLLTLLIVAIPQTAPIAAERPAMDEIFTCSFDESWDKDYEGWPDRWTRRRGPGFPRYVNMSICREPSPSDASYLRIDLDGGGAVAYSPPIPISSDFGYVMRCRMKTDGLTHDRAFLSITLMNGKQGRIKTFFSQKIDQTDGWQLVELGPVTSNASDASLAVLGLHLEPTDKADLTGTACFDDVQLGRVARMTLSLASPVEPVAKNVFQSSAGIAVRFDASGFRDAASQAYFQLLDVDGETLADSRTSLTLEPRPDDESALLTGKAEWLPPVPGPGFYRIRAKMTAADRTAVGATETVVAVIEPRVHPWLSEFGWTLPDGCRPYSFEELLPLFRQTGVGRVKYPLWFAASAEPAKVDKLVRFSRQLTASGIELVGLLADPPFSVPDQFDPRRPPTAAEIFTAPEEVWLPSLEAAIAGLSTEVRYWQLGVDTDTSFVGYPDLPKKIDQIKGKLDQVGSGIELGFGWDWTAGLPGATVQPSHRMTSNAGAKRPANKQMDQPAWQFISLSGTPPVAAPDEAGITQAERWAVLDVLDNTHPRAERAAGLVRQMVEAKASGVQGIFLPQVFDVERGLFDEDGLPNDLLLPWRTTAVLLGGTEPIGSIVMPGGSSNRIFVRDRHAVMAVWNDRPCAERLYLGRGLQQFDPWGRRVRLESDSDLQRIAVGPMPTFVVGVDVRAAEWRQGLRLATTRLPSVFGSRQSNEVQITNPLDKPARGMLTLKAPSGWRVEPSEFRFVLAAGETMSRQISITLPFDATAGRHEVLAEFKVQSAPESQNSDDHSAVHSPEVPTTASSSLLCFTAYRQIDVGLGDVTIELATTLTDSGILEINQRLVNHGGRPVSFGCMLLAPGRRAVKAEILDQPPGVTQHTYRLPEGVHLVGKPLWLRAQDLTEGRTLNYRIVAQP